jgi:hypothetical protein
MSWPSNQISPEVGFSSPTITLPIVVLPQPDSPTRPKVSPLEMVKLTSETALTDPIFRCITAPAVTGNSLTRWRTSRNSEGGASPAPVAVVVAVVVI